MRRFLDDRAFVENRRILDLVRGIEGKALALRDAAPAGAVTDIEAMGVQVDLPFERPLFTPSRKPELADLVLADDEGIDTARLFAQVVVDKVRLRATIRHALRRQAQVTLREVLDAAPLQQGLAELVAYLELAHAGATPDAADGVRAIVDDAVEDSIRWHALDATGAPLERRARFARVIFTR